jgi:hypothetical protein
LKAGLAKMERRKCDQSVAKLAQEWDSILKKNAGEKEAIESEALLGRN